MKYLLIYNCYQIKILKYIESNHLNAKFWTQKAFKLLLSILNIFNNPLFYYKNYKESVK